ncbi:tetratricopeptide repeat protein [Longimicrobium sp.]|uniref:tetratricopeptide repeat protein n=1 Tax=Longimicrobium sp. TaxID=2029185 RepID=UPI002B53CEC9|nr:tetratricopeptide repeat protein [Longimicrobium sp.]HSU17301.1 tetratricopeptide repeat protein [Longimicrobium sp.]
MTIRLRALGLAALLAAAAHPAAAQSGPRRPALPAGADSNDARAWYRLGISRLGDDPRAAADAFRWASRLDPHWADPLYARRAALLMANRTVLLGYYSGSETAWRQAQPADSLAAHALEMDPFLNRNLEGELARAFLNAAIERDTRGGETRDQLTEVERAHLSALILANQTPATRAWLAAADGDLDEALRFYDQAIHDARYKSDLYADKGRVLALRGDLAGALSALQSAVAARAAEQNRRLVFLYQSKAQYQATVAALHERLGHADSARAAYGAALQEDLSFAYAHAHLAALSLAAGDTAGALGEFALAVQIRPGDPGLRVDAATILAATGHVEEAVEHLKKAVELDPAYADPYVMLGRLHDASSLTADALRYYEAFLAHAARTNPQYEWAQQRIAQLRAAP